MPPLDANILLLRTATTTNLSGTYWTRSEFTTAPSLLCPTVFQDRLTTLELKLFSSARYGIFTMSENDERSGIKELKDLIFLLNGVPQCFTTLEPMYGTISVMLPLFKCRRYSCPQLVASLIYCSQTSVEFSPIKLNLNWLQMQRNTIFSNGLILHDNI